MSRFLISDRQQDEKHIIALDWTTHGSIRCCQLGFITPVGEMPGKDSLIELSMTLYEKSHGIDPKTVFNA